MKTKNLLLLIALILGLAMALFISISHIRALNKDIRKYKYNQTVLLTQKDSLLGINHAYRFADSLNALKTISLQMSLKEYERFRQQDLELIEQLNIKKKELEKVISAQALSIYSLQSQLYDSVGINPSTNEPDTLKCFSSKDQWIDLSGCIELASGNVNLSIHEQVPLSIAETVKYKRFLGFLWKTRKVKHRHVDVFSKNPHVIITNIDFVHIE